jgi:DNA replication protein DnaC
VRAPEDPKLADLDTRMKALGRPVCAFTDIVAPAKVAAHRARLVQWEQDHPDAAQKWRDLAADYAARTIELDELAEAEATVKLARLKVTSLAGDVPAAAIDHPEPSLAKRESMAWWLSGNWALVLCGDAGGGKTTAAAWVAEQVLLKHRRVCWVDCAKASLERIYGPDAEARMKRATEAELLVLNDIGVDGATDVWKSWMHAVIDHRWARGLRTVMTANMGRERLAERLGPRVTDRLADRATWVGTGAGSYRRDPKRRSA